MPAVSETEKLQAPEGLPAIYDHDLCRMNGITQMYHSHPTAGFA
jgi:hypothetical protein